LNNHRVANNERLSTVFGIHRVNTFGFHRQQVFERELLDFFAPRQLDAVDARTVRAEVLLAAERLAAVLAAVRLVVVVHQHVTAQVSRLHAADLALARPVARMDLLVLRQLLPEAELSAARGALVRPLAGVKQEVIAQQRRNPEPLSAQRALMAQRLVVFHHMLAQQAAHPEALPALRARMTLNPRVHRDVSPEA